jgi:phosphatidate cytidylyltransferase
VLRWRLVTALVLAPAVLGAIAIGQWAVLAVVLVVVAWAARELASALEPLPFPAALGAGTAPVLFSIPFGVNGVLAGVIASLPLTLFWLSARPEARTLRGVLALLLMALWVGAPMAHIGLLGQLSVGSSLVIVAVAGPWFSDAGAYFAGRFFGRHSLFPAISPKKTVEGSLGGLLTATVVVALYAHTLTDFTLLQGAAAGAIVSLLSQAGDLFESMLKRLLEIKDLGHTLPGHGGILDRIDSLLFTAPGIYYLYILFLSR